jgi:acetyltransferase-like isoleucine patch superfamily enzyme
MAQARSWLRQRFNDVEMAALKLSGLIPIHRARVAALRAYGMSIGDDAVIYHGYQVRKARRISVGARSIIGDGAILDGRGGLVIGEDVNFSTGVNIWTAQHDWLSPDFAYLEAPVTIGHHAWISTRVVVLPGTVIGEGAVIAAGAVVKGTIEPWTLAGGVPARHLAHRSKDLSYPLGNRKRKAWWW